MYDNHYMTQIHSIPSNSELNYRQILLNSSIFNETFLRVTNFVKTTNLMVICDMDNELRLLQV